VTGFSWSLEKIFCRPRNSRYIAIVRGPGALTRSQLRSSFVCSVVGSILLFFVFLSFLIFLGAGLRSTLLVVAAGFFLGWPSIQSTYQLYKTGRRFLNWSNFFQKGFGRGTDHAINQEGLPKSGLEEDSEGVYLCMERYRVTKPTRKLYWTLFGLELVIFVLWPLASLLRVQNYRVAALFAVVSGVTGVRYYISAMVALEEVGDLVYLDNKRRSQSQRWREMSRVNEIVGSITTGRSRNFWMALLGITGLMFLALFFMAVLSQTDSANADASIFDIPYVFLDDFEYIQRDSLRYPACQLSNDLGESPLTSMVSNCQAPCFIIGQYISS
jgi:lipase ATG15